MKALPVSGVGCLVHLGRRLGPGPCTPGPVNGGPAGLCGLRWASCWAQAANASLRGVSVAAESLGRV